MQNSKLYQPPPPPPRPKEAARDPLIALSRAPTMVSPVAPRPAAEELTDLTDDEGLEEWANGGTRVMPKPQRQPAQTAMQAPPSVAPTVSMDPRSGTSHSGSMQPSYYPVAMSAAPKKASSAGLWIAGAGVLVLLMGAGAAAAAGIYVYHTHDVAAAAVPVTETAAPTVTATVTDAPTVAATVTAAPTATTTSTSTLTVTSTRRSAPTNTSTTSTSSGAGSIRTFAAGNGKPVYVDGKQVGVGGAKLTTVCGHHSVAVGLGHAKTVDIPCNGSTITVGTPDGT